MPMNDVGYFYFLFQTKSIFKDKKLQRLWEKAYKAGLEEDELILLKNEFQHHQEKLDEFHDLKQLQVIFYQESPFLLFCQLFRLFQEMV